MFFFTKFWKLIIKGTFFSGSFDETRLASYKKKYLPVYMKKLCQTVFESNNNFVNCSYSNIHAYAYILVIE